MRAGAHRDWIEWRSYAILSLLFCCIAAQRSSAEEEAAKEARTVLFGSLEAGRSVFVSAGRKRTLAGSLDESGPVFMMTSASGRKRERDSVAGIMTYRQAAEGSALIGYQWRAPDSPR